MLTIFHGDNQSSSRTALNAELDRFRGLGYTITYLPGIKLTLPELESALLTESLFEQTALVIEGIFSRVLSKEKKLLLAMLSGYNGDKPILVWEPKEVTKPNLKNFGQAKLSLHKTPAVIFQFLDSLKPGNYALAHSLLVRTAELSDPGFIFIMTARHIANLLIAQSGDVSILPPFTRGRLQSQSRAWSETQLLAFHRGLHDIDLQIKTGTTKLDYFSQLDLLLASLLR